MADVLGSTGAATRAADVLLRSAGGRMVLLRMPSPGVAGDPTEQLGLAAPEFQDAELAPVVFRRSRARVSGGKTAEWELLVSASGVRTLLGGYGAAYSSAEGMFAAAFGVVVDGVLMEIVSATGSEGNGEVYVYRLMVKEPEALVV